MVGKVFEWDGHMAEMNATNKYICDWMWTAIIENLINLLFRCSFSSLLSCFFVSALYSCSFATQNTAQNTMPINRVPANVASTLQGCSCPCLSTYNKNPRFRILFFACFLNFAFCAAFFRWYLLLFLCTEWVVYKYVSISVRACNIEAAVALVLQIAGLLRI